MPSANINFANNQAYTEDNVVVYNIFVSNIKKSTTKNEVLHFFQGYGEVLNVRLIVISNCPTKIGFVNFADSKAAAKVLKNRNYYLNGTIRVKACYSWQQPSAETAESLRPNKLQIANDAQLHPKTDTETEQPSCSSTNSMELSALILNLNDDCLERICKNLITRDQINFARTCQRFSDIFITVSKVEYKMLILNKLESLTLWQIRQFLKMTGPQIESLVGQIPFEESERIVEFLGAYCINSKRVNVAIDAFGYDWLQKLIGKMSLCAELTLQNVILTDDFIQIIKCMPKLKILKLEKITDLTGEHICELTDIEELSLRGSKNILPLHFKNICKNVTNLRALDIRKCKLLSSADFQEIVKHLNKLESLKFSCNHVQYECIAQLPKLRSLEIVAGIQPIGHKIFEELVKYQSEQLEELILVGYRSLNLQKASLIGDLKKLKKLCGDTLDDQCLEKFCQLTELEEINLENCYALTNNGLLNLLEHCPKLNRLNISRGMLITNAFIFDALTLLEKQVIQTQREGPILVLAYHTYIDKFVTDNLEFKALSDLMKVTFEDPFCENNFFDDVEFDDSDSESDYDYDYDYDYYDFNGEGYESSN